MSPPERSAANRTVDPLRETPEQEYVGARDLTAWPTAAGRAAASLAGAATTFLAPYGVLLVTLLGGVVLVGLLTVTAGEVYEAVVEVDGVAVLDRPLLDAVVAGRTDGWAAAATAYTHLGGRVGMTVLATSAAVGVAIAWRQWTPVLLTAVTAAGTVAMTVVGKAAVGRTRPPLAQAVPPFEGSPSFPSGHALSSVAIAGILAYLLIRRQRSASARFATVALAATFAVTMGLSRVYLGHHWLTDVLVAWALGLAWLVTVITAHRLFLTVRRGGPAARPQ